MWIKKFFDDKMESVKRFFVPFLWTIFLFALTTWRIYTESGNEICETLIYVGIFGFFLAVLGKLKAEWLEDGNLVLLKFFSKSPADDKIRLKDKKKAFLLASLPWISVVAFAIYPWVRNYDDSYVQMGYCGLIIATIAIIMFFISQTSKSLTQFIKGGFFSVLIVGILCGGISLCLWAIHSLIWAFPQQWKVYSVALSFIGIIGSGNLVLSGINVKLKEEINKIYKWILYVAFAVYLVLLAILVIYFAKLAITMAVPNNRVALFGNIAVLFSVFFVFVLKQFEEENKLVRIFQKYIGWLMLLIIAMNFWGMYIRVGEYGLTGSRYVCLWLNDVAVVFAVLTLIMKGKFCKWIFPAIALVAIVLTLTPMNVIKVPFENQKAALIDVLLANDMLDSDWKVVAKSDISDEDKAIISSKWQAIRWSAELDKTGWAYLKDMSPNDIFGFDLVWGWPQDDKGYVSFSCYNASVDISGYSRLEEYYGERPGEMDGWLYELYLEHGDYAEVDEMHWDFADGRRVIVKNINGEVDVEKGTAEVQWVNGYLLY